ncbi:carotenoid oxygenase family protein [Marinicella sp. W31]|uniref:carotenoid oxygenase family protein n=1 Tax=Marinicella sp. W31 TaxID=3023713 RepID=UPI0037584DE1
MNRRKFLTSAMYLAGLSVGFKSMATSKAFKQHFATALKDNPHLRGFRSIQQDIAPTQVAWQGQLPDELVNGVLYRNGPTRMELGEQRYTHLFDGDGMIQQYRLHKDGLKHQGRFVRTSKYEKETEAGRFLYSGAGSHLADSLPITGPHTVNAANISVLPVNKELWALWEAGSPYRMDMDSLETLGRQEWSDALKGVPFSAHPRIDTDGTIWNFGDISFGQRSALVIYKLSPSGQLQKHQVVNIPKTSYIHDFAITDRYLLFFLPPMSRPNPAETYISQFVWHEGQAGQVIVLDKNTLETVHVLDTEPGFVFHFGNAWQDKDTIHVNCCWYDNADIMLKGMSDLLTMSQAKLFEPSEAAIMQINLNKKQVAVKRTGINMEFPQFDDRYHVKASQWQLGGHRSQRHSYGFDTVSRVNTETGKHEKYVYGEGVMIEEPLFVPKNNAKREGQGYVVQTFLNYHKDHTGLAVFNSERLADGPIAQATLPYGLPTGLHGTFVKS